VHSEATGDLDHDKSREELIAELDMLRREVASLRKTCVGEYPAPGRVGELQEEVAVLKESMRSLGGAAEMQREELNRQIDRLKAMNVELDESRCRLEASEGRYSAIGELIPYGFWSSSPEGNVEHISQSFLDLAGVSLETLKRQGWTAVLPPEDRKKAAKDWKECIGRQGCWDYEYRIFGADGQFHTVLSRGLPIRDAGGRVTSWAGINLDITERKRVEDELKLSDRMFNVLVNANIIGIFISAADGTIIEANDSYLDIIGYDRDDLKAGGINCARMTPPEFRKLRRLKEEELTSDGFMAPHEKEYIRKDGSRVPVLLGMGLLDDESRARIGYVIDLTEHKRRELLLKRYRLMFDAIRDPILFMRMDGSIVDANYAAIETYGYTHKELLAMNVSNLRVMGQEPEMQEKLEQCYKHGCHFETTHRRKDDSTIVLDISSKGMLHGSEKIIVAIARDITDRKRSEELLRRRQRELETLLDTLPGYVAFKDTNSVYIMANQKACEAIGVGKSDISGKTDYDLYPHRLAEKYRADDWRVISSGRPLYDLEETIMHGERPVTVITSKAPLKNDMGMVVGIISLSLDISQRKRAEDALRRSEASLAKAQQLSHMGSWDWSLISGRMSWSEETCRIFDIDRVGFPATLDAFINLIHPDDRRRVRQAIEDAVRTEKGFTADFRVMHADGSVRHVHNESEIEFGEKGEITRLFGTVQDITERKQFEDALRESEKRFKVFYDTGIFGVFACRNDGRVVEANDRYLEMLGYDREDLQAGRIDRLRMTPQEYRHLDGSAMREAHEKGYCTPFEKEYVRKDGQRVPIIEGFGIIDAESQTRFGFVIDIAERKKAENALRESEANLARAEHIASLGNWDRDFRTGEMRWSDGNFEIFGYRPGECLPDYETFRSRIHKEDVGRVEKALDATILRDKPYNLDFRVVWPDGSVRHVHAESDRLIRDPAGNPLRMFGILQDITERKHIEEELRLRETELAEAQQIAHMGSWVWDTESDRFKWSDETYRIFGLTPVQPAIGLKGLLEYVHPDDREQVERAIGDAIMTGAAYDQEYRIIRADGTERVIHSQAKVIRGAPDRPARMLGTIRDVTERRMSEEALIHAKDQAELYVDLMGHDINNMNHMAINYLEFMRETMNDKGMAEKGDLAYVGRAIEVLNNSSNLIENVRKLRNLYLDRYRTKTMDLSAVLADVKKDYYSVPGRDVTIVISARPDCLVAANSLLRDVFANLIGNAIRHSSGPVNVRIALDRVRQGESPYYRVAVEDDGPGIPEWKKWQIFERLKQGQTRGSGLGLYMVKTLVRHFRGSVSVEDRVPGDNTKGSRFIVMLPAIEK
jgi:PAS domain S-box-containing protein